MSIGKKINRLKVGLSAARGWERVWGLPLSAQVEPTDRCNLRCIMCPRTYMSAKEESHDLTLADFNRILDEIPTLKSIQLSGFGEPFLNAELPGMIKLARARGIHVATNSNGTCFSKANVKKIVESGLNILKLSIDAPTPETYYKIRKADLEKAKNGLKLLVKEKEESGSATPSMRLNVVLMKDNVLELDLFFDFAHEIGIQAVRFKPLNIIDDKLGIASCKVDFRLPPELLHRAGEKAACYKIRTNLDEVEQIFVRGKDIAKKDGTKKNIPCYILWKECYISAGGDVRPCCEFYSDDYTMGNVLTESFKDIWNGPKFRAFRKKSFRGELPAEVCKTCNRFYVNYEAFEKIEAAKRRLGPFGVFVKTGF